MGLFDVHAHLTHPKLRHLEEAVVERARNAGVTTIVCNGLNPRDNQRVLELSQRHAIIRPALGFYPIDAVLQDMLADGVEYPLDDDREVVATQAGIDWLRAHVGEAFAVGEIGLDGYWVPEPYWERQEHAFRTLVQIALDHQKTIIIHSRKREARAFEILSEMNATKVVWHCFGGKVKLARRIAEATSHFFSIPANARRSESFTRMLQTLPRDRILLETDCPYLGPVPGEDNEPANVAETFRYASELWGVNADETQRTLEGNFTRCFGVAP